MHASNVLELDEAILEEELISMLAELELVGVSMLLEAGLLSLLAGVSLEVGAPLLDFGGTFSLLEAGALAVLLEDSCAVVFSMAEEFVSPTVGGGAIGLFASQAVSARAKIDAVVSPQAMLVNFVFMKLLLFINIQPVSSKKNIQSFLCNVKTFMQQNLEKLLKIT